MSPVLSISIMENLGPLLLRAERRRACATARLDESTRSELGQFPTGADVAAFPATFFDVRSGPLRLLDPGAGVGSLAAAVVERFHTEAACQVSVTAVEVDETSLAPLGATADCPPVRCGGPCRYQPGQPFSPNQQRPTVYQVPEELLAPLQSPKPRLHS